MQTNNSYKPCYEHTKYVLCAVLGKPRYEGSSGHLSSKIIQTKLWHVLLDSGSDGEVLFVKKCSKEIPYTKWLIPQVWQSSMWHFKTDKIVEGIELEFVEYSENKRITISPDIMEYKKNDYNTKFDLIIGNQTMKELGIILDFSTNMIKID